MAKVTVKRFTPEPPPTTVEEVTLTLSEDEAMIVGMLVGNVGGNIHAPIRQAAEGIWTALEAQGLVGSKDSGGRYRVLRGNVHIGSIEAT